MVKVRFKHNYIASRGPGIAGVKNQEREYEMTPALQKCIDEGICELVKAPKAENRKKATGKKGAEKT